MNTRFATSKNPWTGLHMTKTNKPIATAKHIDVALLSICNDEIPAHRRTTGSKYEALFAKLKHGQAIKCPAGSPARISGTLRKYLDKHGIEGDIKTVSDYGESLAHESDCAVHNAPAVAAGPCSCRAALSAPVDVPQDAQRDPRDEEAWIALGFLSGLHPCMTIDGDQPMAMAEAIFTHVQAELKQWRDEAAKLRAELVSLAKERSDMARWRIAQAAARATSGPASGGQDEFDAWRQS